MLDRAFRALAERVYEQNLELPRLGLVSFTWGNVSAVDREREALIIKPSGVAYETMKVEDMVVVDLSTGARISGQLKPSSDTDTHRHLYQTWETVGGIVHTHSRWATARAQSGRELPAYGTTHADYFHGAVPCSRKLRQAEMETDYELNTGRVIVETFDGLKLDPLAIPAILIAGHGPFAWGKDPEEAVYHAAVLDECAMMAQQTELLNPQVQPIEQGLLDVHYYRKHGDKAYYGQSQ